MQAARTQNMWKSVPKEMLCNRAVHNKQSQSSVETCTEHAQLSWQKHVDIPFANAMWPAACAPLGHLATVLALLSFAACAISMEACFSLSPGPPYGHALNLHAHAICAHRPAGFLLPIPTPEQHAGFTHVSQWAAVRERLWRPGKLWLRHPH